MATIQKTEITPLLRVVPAPGAMDPRAAAIAAPSVETEELLRSTLDLREKMIRLGLIPRPPPKQWFARLAWWFRGLTGWFPRLARLWRQSLDDIRCGREASAAHRQLVKDCLDHYNRRHPGNEYEPVGNLIQNPYLGSRIIWVHGNFVARKKGSGVFSFLTAPRSVFFFELAYIDGFEGVVTCTTVEEPAYSVLGYPLWWATRTSGRLDFFCKTCYCRFGIPRPGVQKLSGCGHSNMVEVCEKCYFRISRPGVQACGHNNVAEVCEMCYYCSDTLHPDHGEFAFGYRHPCHPYPKR